MADFSKQWAELYDHEFPWDFDIEKIAKDLHKGNYYPIICEGFGFIAISKTEEGKTNLAFQIEEYGTKRIEWIDYDTFMNLAKNKYLSETQANGE